MINFILIISVSLSVNLFSQTFHSLIHQGIKRTFYVYIPDIKEDELYGVVFVLHGDGGTAKNMIQLTGYSFNNLAHKYRYIAVYPQGYKNYFNDGRKSPSYPAFKKNIDDIGFFKKIIEYLRKKYRVGADIYFAGISNGAMMGFRIGCETDIAKGIAAVSASMPYELYGCLPPRKLKVLIIAGDKDQFIPYNGGDIKGPFGVRFLGRVVGAEDSYIFWSSRNGCIDEDVINRYEDAYSKLIAVKRFKKCLGNSVALYKVEGGGAGWPGAIHYLSTDNIGPTFQGFDAANEIISFFFD